MTEYYTHEEAKTNCPEGSHVEYHRTCEETEAPFGWRWCIVTPPPSIVAEPWAPTEPVTLLEAAKIADEWVPGCNKWAAFENMPSEPKQLHWCWHGAKALAIAQDSGNPERIARERASFMRAVDTWCDVGSPEAGAPDPTEQAQEAQEAAPEGPSLLTQCVVATAAGYMAGRMIRNGHMGRALTSAVVYGVAKPAFASLFKAAVR
jgi:hypothetical protein